MNYCYYIAYNIPYTKIILRSARLEISSDNMCSARLGLEKYKKKKVAARLGLARNFFFAARTGLVMTPLKANDHLANFRAGAFQCYIMILENLLLFLL